MTRIRMVIDLPDPYGISPKMMSRMPVSLLRMMERTSSDREFFEDENLPFEEENGSRIELEPIGSNAQGYVSRQWKFMGEMITAAQPRAHPVWPRWPVRRTHQCDGAKEENSRVLGAMQSVARPLLRPNESDEAHDAAPIASEKSRGNC
ncbi:hypothetical protein HAX54_029985 [Datura stramonium]|uniref:Uncharacterized protein n=1 Tax=Datura stramonium TaxID=4076 RepID=A0ABS8SAL4_DATST|nr:hypothetical protein [Datura stramonium]